MTVNPPDLLGMRGRYMQVTGIIDPRSVGIQGDSAHHDGYHVGWNTLQGRGLLGEYSTRLPQDRVPGTDNASAEDFGDGWAPQYGGRDAWVRWCRLVAGALTANHQDLRTIRAINYTDGVRKWRLDREAGFKPASTSDTVESHLHTEWYRGTINTRGASFALLLQLALEAQRGRPDVAGLTDVQTLQLQNTEHMLSAMRDLADPTLDAGDGKGMRVFPSKLAQTLREVQSGVAAIAQAPRAPVVDPVAFADSLTISQCEAIGRGIGAALFNAIHGGSPTA